MATNRFNIGTKFQNADIPSESDFKEIFDSFVHKDEDKADFQMVETGTDTEHYVTPALLRTGLQNIGIITGNSFMPHKENFEDSFSGTILPLTYFPIPKSVKVFKNGQLLQEGPDYTVNYDTAQIKFLETVSDRNLEVDYWYKNLSPNPGSGSGTAIDFTSFLHTSGNETKNGLLTFNNTTATSTSGIILKNSGAAATSLDVTNSGAGSGISLQNSSTGSGVKVSNAGAGVAVQINSETASTGDILQVSKNNVVKAKIDNEGKVTAEIFVTSGGTSSKFVKGDGSLDTTVYAEDTKVIHTTGNESKDGALNLTHNSSVQDVLTITKNNSANCLKLVQNSSSNATTSTFDTTTADNNRKAISIQKIQVEKAFITHDGNVSGTSFTTLNEKADITDGFLTLASSTSPSATAGHAKLYAKTDGTTDMYVMGSDGVEKKIGGVVDLSGKENTIALGTTAQYYRGDKSWQTLDKSAVGLTNVDNTSDLNKPISTATQAALNGKAIDANVVHTTGNESFTGYKSATNFPSLSGILLTNASGASTSVLGVTNNSSTEAVSIDSNSNGAALLVRTNSSLGGTALKIEASFPSTGKALLFAKTGVDTTWISNNGDFTAPKLIKSGGTSSQFLKADGSVDGNVYLKSTDLSNYIQLNDNSRIGGFKSFDNSIRFNNNTSNAGISTSSFIAMQNNHITLGSMGSGQSTANVVSFDTTTANSTVLKIPATSGTIALTNNPTSITSTAFIKSGGTSSQYLMADGSVTNSSPQALPYKSYVAMISQSGTSAPVLTQIFNNLGQTVTSSYQTVGYYRLDVTGGAFITDKTAIFYSDSHYQSYTSYAVIGTQNYVSVLSTTQNVSGTLINSAISGSFIEIRVYI
ncbi:MULTISPECIES: hypothetical protein [unclassified Flavobacterium]|uniref:hypothetical protein n=1 Tax=unclassified Flavobacterium TaxID=196869 RepID=UPI00131E7914|nr:MULTISPECIES: hypothetical protein [unclassified Flavobacterium]